MILERLDIDPRQWRAMMRTSFRLLTRQASAFSFGNRSSMGGLWAGLLLYGVIGVMLAAVAGQASQPTVASFILLSIIAVFIASSVLLEFGSTIITADDMLILGVRPVSSRTYFAARIAMVIAFVLLYAGALGGPAAFTFGMRFGPLVAAAWLAAVAGAAVATGLFMVVVYTAALRHVPASRIRSVMGYVQLGLSFLIYGGYGILTSQMGALFRAQHLPSFAPFFPTAWFASLVGLAAGDGTQANWLGATLALVSLGALMSIMAGRISLSYQESVLTSESEAPAYRVRSSRTGLGLARFLTRPEDRAIALLVIRQFRYDTKFRMSVLTIIPLTLIYIYQGVRQGPGLTDPFVSPEGFGASTLLYIAVILFPVILKNEIVRSDMYQASWVFHAAPVHKGDLMLSVRNVVTALFVLPYLVLLALVFLYFFHHPGHVLLHMIVLTLAADVFLQVLSMVSPRLPFSRPRTTGERIASVSAAMIAGPFFILGFMALFTFYLYTSVLLYLAGVGFLAGIDSLLRLLLKHRVAAVGDQLECTL